MNGVVHRTCSLNTMVKEIGVDRQFHTPNLRTRPVGQRENRRWAIYRPFAAESRYRCAVRKRIHKPIDIFNSLLSGDEYILRMPKKQLRDVHVSPNTFWGSP